MGGLAVY